MLALFDISGLTQTLLVYVMPVAGCTLVVFGLFQVAMDLRKTTRQKVIDRLKERRAVQDRKSDRVSKDSLIRKRLQGDQRGGLEGIVARLSVVPKLQTMLDQANVGWSASRLLVNLTGLAILSGLGVVVLGQSPVVGGLVGGGAFALPLFGLAMKRKRRVAKLVDQLPDVFELISQALRAGHSLASGIHLVSEQLPAPAAEEFARVWHEQNLGIKIEDALRNMADRTDQLDVRFFVTAVLIQRQTGGDLAEVLDKIGAVIRSRIKLFGQVKALTAEGRLSGYVLLALPVVVFFAMMFVNREYAELLITYPAGKGALIAAVVMQMMGFAMIKKITNIKV